MLDVCCLWGLQHAGPLVDSCLKAVARWQVGDTAACRSLQQLRNSCQGLTACYAAEQQPWQSG